MRRSVLPLSLGLVSALIVVAILFAAGVERVTFTSGRPFDETFERGRRYDAPGAGPMQPLRPADLAVAYGLLAGILVAIILFLRRNAGREGLPSRKGGRWIALVAAATVIGMVTVVLVFGVDWSPDDGEEAASEEASSSATASEELRSAEYRNIDELMGTGGEDTDRGTAPGILLITGILAVVAVGLCVSLVVVLRRRRRAPEEDLAEEILGPVRVAVAELRLGRDPRGAVERCYRQMLHTLAERSRVDPACLTPREFVAALAGVGLDGAAIGELSTLFEEVHYGHRPEEEMLAARALQCMTAITTSYAAPEAAP